MPQARAAQWLCEFSEKQESTISTDKPATFQFGKSAATSSAAPKFNFGSLTKDQPKVEQPKNATTASEKPAFSFGSPFGSKSSDKPAASTTGAFSFGASTTSAFGSQATKNNENAKTTHITILERASL